MKRQILLALFCAVLFFSQNYAATIRVPQDRPTIQAGVSAAGMSDTILVAPGIYEESIAIGPVPVCLTSQIGAAQTTIVGRVEIVGNSQGPVELSGFTLKETSGSNIVTVRDSWSAILDNVFENNNGWSTVVLCDNSALLIRRNLFHHNNVGSACVGVVSGTAKIINNTFDSNTRGFFSLVEGTIALNNIVTRSTEYGVYGLYSRLDYNDVWNNGMNYDQAQPGLNDISSDPRFSHPSAGDYSLLENSPCIDAGVPDLEYLDPDGTRSDIGAYYLPAQFPLSRGIQVGSAINRRVPEAFPIIAWQFLDLNNSVQHAFELQIGIDRDWSAAELLATGETITADTFYHYDGPELTEGASYVGRLRVSNEAGWGVWVQFDFRLNQTPQPLTAVFPMMGDALPVSGVSLQVQNGIDLDHDSLRYVFEVYTDEQLMELLTTQGDRESHDGLTFSNVIGGLLPGRHYWWRARASDGFESGAWSSTGHFFTRLPARIRVPQDQPSIQSALNLAGDGDTVLVAAGIYHEFITFPAHAVKLISEAGPEATTLARPADSGTNGNTISFPYPVSREAEVNGFSMSGEHAESFIVFGDGVRAVLKNNVFRNLLCETAIILTGQGNPLIEKNLFVNNVVGWYCIEAFGPVDIINNTFDHNSRGVYSANQAATFINNILINSAEYGLHGSFRLHDYNNIWQNLTNYENTGPAANEISVDPEFVDQPNGDYHLKPISPCIDAGDPRVEFEDPNGTRNDIGAFSLEYTSPIAYSVRVGQFDNFHVVEQFPLIAWQYFDDVNQSQVRFEVQVGDNNNWSAAELWDSGDIESDSMSIQYAGIPLVSGVTYFARIRVNNGLNWGEWQEFTFRRNSPPPIPELVAPINNELTPRLDARLQVHGLPDTENDLLRYDFAVYSDSNMTQMVYSALNQIDSITPLVSGLLPDRTYWWRARSGDGRENSAWSSLALFDTRGGMQYHVPESYSSIQEAIDAAHHGDTIMVAPGHYFGSLNFRSKALLVTSSDGPQATSITPNFPSLVDFSNSEVDEAFGIKGFTVQDFGGPYVIVIENGSHPLIEDMRFLSCRSQIVVLVYNGSPIIRRNIFAGNLVEEGCIVIQFGSPRVENNTIFDNSLGVLSQSVSAIVRNNIIAYSSGYGLAGRFNLVEYNDVWLNHPDYNLISTPLINNIKEDPQFRDYVSADFRLSLGSPCINSGNPASIFNDPDGSRNDIGAYPFVRQYPPEFHLLTPADGLTPVLLSVAPVFKWTSATTPNLLGPLTYTILVASDSLFNFASVIENLDSTLTVLPAPLTWGTRYWWKVKASIAGEGETWSNEVFTFRTLKLGDADGSGRLNITDIVFLINYIFVGGRPPVPLVAGDMNCSGRINIADAVYLVNYLFGDGPQPCSDFPTTAPAFGPDEATANR